MATKKVKATKVSKVTKKVKTTKAKTKTIKTKAIKGGKTMSKNQPPKKTDEKCVWLLGTPCSGDTYEVEMFDHQIRIPICEGHLEQHKEIMTLHKNKYDVEEILNQTPEWRKQETLTLKLSGLDNDEVDL